MGTLRDSLIAKPTDPFLDDMMGPFAPNLPKPEGGDRGVLALPEQLGGAPVPDQQKIPNELAEILATLKATMGGASETASGIAEDQIPEEEDIVLPRREIPEKRKKFGWRKGLAGLATALQGYQAAQANKEVRKRGGVQEELTKIGGSGLIDRVRQSEKDYLDRIAEDEEYNRGQDEEEAKIRARSASNTADRRSRRTNTMLGPMGHFALKAAEGPKAEKPSQYGEKSAEFDKWVGTQPPDRQDELRARFYGVEDPVQKAEKKVPPTDMENFTDWMSKRHLYSDEENALWQRMLGMEETGKPQKSMQQIHYEKSSGAAASAGGSYRGRHNAGVDAEGDVYQNAIRDKAIEIMKGKKDLFGNRGNPVPWGEAMQIATDEANAMGWEDAYPNREKMGNPYAPGGGLGAFEDQAPPELPGLETSGDFGETPVERVPFGEPEPPSEDPRLMQLGPQILQLKRMLKDPPMDPDTGEPATEEDLIADFIKQFKVNPFELERPVPE